jgi:hypothetical protein
VIKPAPQEKCIVGMINNKSRYCPKELAIVVVAIAIAKRYAAAGINSSG